MGRAIIRKGDPTSHGGEVIEGSSFDLVEGKPVAFVGHKVSCRKCKGIFEIIEGVPVTTFYGKGVALEGMKTSCGATLIATQFTTTLGYADGGGGSAYSPAATSSNALSADSSKSTGNADASDVAKPPADTAIHDEQFILKDADDQPLSDVAYKILKQGSVIHRGTTDAEGKTARIKTDHPEQLDVVPDTDHLN